MLRATLLASSVGALVAYVPGVILAWQAGHHVVVAVDTLSYLVILTMALRPSLPFGVRAGALVVIPAIISLALLSNGGSVAAGSVWMAAFPIMAALFFGLRPALVALGVQAAMITAIGFAVAWDHLDWGGALATYPQGVTATWLVTGTNILLISIVLSLSGAVLLKALEGTALEEAAARRNLERETEERQQLQSRLRQGEKLEAMGTLAGGIAHDFNNLLLPILLRSREAMDALPEHHAAQEALGDVHISASRARDMVRRILVFSRGGESSRELVEVDREVAEVAALLRSSLPSTIQMDMDLQAPGAQVLAASSELHQVSARDLHGNDVGFEPSAASWASSNVGVVTVDGGRVTAVGNGHAEVSVSVDGVSSSVPVTVEQVVGSLALSAQEVGFTALGSTQTVHVVVFDARGNPIEGYGGDEVTWSSSNDAVFAVSSRGVLTSVAVGAAQLTVRAGGVEAVASVTVAQSVASITVGPSPLTFRALGDTATVSATAFDANGAVIPTTAGNFSWDATAPGVATVSHLGTVTATGPGLTQVSATLGAAQGSASIIASINPYAVTVGKAGTGTGTVASTSTGAVSGEIDCGPVCSRDFHNGATVTLTAVADAGSEFFGWSGAGCFGTGACVIDVSAATSVTAEFAALSTPFIATLYPGIINGGWGVHRTLGYEFTVASPVEVTDLRGRFTGTHAVWIHNVTGGTTVASAVVTATQSSWGVSVLAEPVTLLPGNTYAAAVWHPAGSFQHSMVTPATFGGITIQRSCSNGANLSNPCGPGAEFYPGWIMGQVDFAFRAAPAPGE